MNVTPAPQIGTLHRTRQIPPGSCSLAGPEVSSARYEALSSLGFSNLCDEVETYLCEPDAEIVDRQILGGGLNGSYIVTLSNGLVATWKPESEEHRLEQRDNLEEGGHQAGREACSYGIDKAMGHLAHVYPCVLRELQDAQTGDSQTGALQLFLPETPSLRSSSTAWPTEFAAIPLTKRQNLAAFDEVTGQLDRHDGNLLRYGIPIDHGLCLPLHNGFQGSYNSVFHSKIPLSRSQIEAMELFQHGDSAKMKALFCDHQLPAEAQEAMQQRISKALESETASFWWRQGNNNMTPLALS